MIIVYNYYNLSIAEKTLEFLRSKNLATNIGIKWILNDVQSVLGRK